MNEESAIVDSVSQWCVILPCSKDEVWAIPQKCLAEIVTLPAESEDPPAQFNWKGQDIPILNLDEEGVTPWRDGREATGLVAVMLGLQGGDWEYYGVALRGEGLGMKDLAREALEEAPDSVREGCTSAFRMGGKVYQIPELANLDKRNEQQRSAA